MALHVLHLSPREVTALMRQAAEPRGRWCAWPGAALEESDGDAHGRLPGRLEGFTATGRYQVE